MGPHRTRWMAVTVLGAAVVVAAVIALVVQDGGGGRAERITTGSDEGEAGEADDCAGAAADVAGSPVPPAGGGSADTAAESGVDDRSDEVVGEVPVNASDLDEAQCGTSDDAPKPTTLDDESGAPLDEPTVPPSTEGGSADAVPAVEPGVGQEERVGEVPVNSSDFVEGDPGTTTTSVSGGAPEEYPVPPGDGGGAEGGGGSANP